MTTNSNPPPIASISELEHSFLQSPYLSLHPSPVEYLYHNSQEQQQQDSSSSNAAVPPPPYLFTNNYSIDKFENAYKSVVENMRKYLAKGASSLDSSDAFKQFELLKVAVACLLIYVQHNHTGPRVNRLLQHPFVYESNEEIQEHFQEYEDDKKFFDAERWKKQRFSTHWEMGNRSEKEEQWFRFDDSIAPVLQFEEEPEGKNRYAINKLSSDGELVYSLVLVPHYLLCAKTILFAQKIGHSASGAPKYLIDSDVLPSADWWRARVLMYQQQLLRHSAGSIFDQLEQLFSRLEPHYGQESALMKSSTDSSVSESFSSDYQPHLVARFYLEYGNMYHLFYKANRGKKYFQIAKQVTGLWTEMTGVLGKRTKFQQKQKSLLVLKARSRNMDDEATSALSQHVEAANSTKQDDGEPSQETDEPSNDTISETPSSALSESGTSAPSEAEMAMPRHVALDEDNPMLEQIQTEGDKEPNLNPIDQVILLALCLDVKNRNPDHGLTTTEMFPYVQRVEMHPNNWMVHTMSLLIKSRLEGQLPKFAQRSLFQIEELVKQFEDDQEECPPEDRLEYFFQLTFPPIYILRKELADRYLEFGGLRTAQSLYEKLELWPEVVRCLHCQNKPKRATELIEARLKETPDNPEMWDLYGTVTDNPDHHEKAWQVSGRTYAKAKRNQGNYFMKNQEWEKAVAAYDLSLKLNYLFPRTWFACGCAAIKCVDWQKALECFSTAVQLDPEDAESWTNLSSIYIETGQKEKAIKTLREALRLKPDNYRMWENHMILCLQTHDYQQVVTSVIQLQSLKSRKEVDVKVLGHLVAVLEKLHSDAESKTAYTALQRRMESMWNVITNNMSQNASVWHIYSIYLELLGRYEDMLKAKQAQVRSLKVQNWSNDEAKFKLVCQAVEECALSQLNIQKLKEHVEDPIDRKLYIHGAISMIQNVLQNDNALILFSNQECYKKLREVLKGAEGLYAKEYPDESV